MIEATTAWKQRSCVIGLLVAFALIALLSVREKSGTFDELYHITGGYSYWTKNDYRIHNTNGNLVQRWIALPLLAMNLNFASTDTPTWHRPGFFGFGTGMEFFFKSGNDPEALLAYSRPMIVVLGVLLGIVVYRWSRSLFGRRAGLISLTLFAFSPTVLAHSQIATSDVATALGFTLSTWCMWKLLHRLSVATLVASCLVVGLTAVVKFSAPLLVFIGLSMAAVRLFRNRTWFIRLPGRDAQLKSRGRAVAIMLALGVAHMITAATIIWACYGFRFSGFNEYESGRDDFCDPWSVVMTMQNETAARIIGFCRDHELLPEAYLHGMAHTLKFAEERPSFLLGECRNTGWWYYHPYCYFAKTTLSTHVLSLLGISALIWRWRKKLKLGWRTAWVTFYPITPIAALLAIYWTVAMRSHLNLGVRHVLPVYPAMFILSGASAIWLRPVLSSRRANGKKKTEEKPATRSHARLIGWGICVLLGLHVLDSLSTYPNYLAYFSPAVGGPSQGYKQLIDSNLDWGQELPSLAKWQRASDQHALPPGPFYLEYSGSSSPKHYGIRFTPLQDSLIENVSLENPYPLRGGTYCISTTVLAAPNEFIHRWSDYYEHVFKRSMETMQLGPEQAPSAESWEDERVACAYLQFARLLAYLRQREPDECINYAMHIYYLTDQDVADAMHGPIEEANP